jgi:hypothetical protein
LKRFSYRLLPLLLLAILLICPLMLLTLTDVFNYFRTY